MLISNLTQVKISFIIREKLLLIGINLVSRRIDYIIPVSAFALLYLDYCGPIFSEVKTSNSKNADLFLILITWISSKEKAIRK